MKNGSFKACIRKRSGKNFKAPDFWFGRRFFGRRDRSVSSFVHRHRRINILEVTSEMSPPLLLHSRNSVQQSARWNFFELKSHRPYPRTLRTKYDLTRFCFLLLTMLRNENTGVKGVLLENWKVEFQLVWLLHQFSPLLHQLERFWPNLERFAHFELSGRAV